LSIVVAENTIWSRHSNALAAPPLVPAALGLRDRAVRAGGSGRRPRRSAACPPPARALAPARHTWRWRRLPPAEFALCARAAGARAAATLRQPSSAALVHRARASAAEVHGTARSASAPRRRPRSRPGPPNQRATAAPVSAELDLSDGAAGAPSARQATAARLSPTFRAPPPPRSRPGPPNQVTAAAPRARRC
jgi:hypothetical protein